MNTGVDSVLHLLSKSKAVSAEHSMFIALVKRFGLVDASEIADVMEWTLPGRLFHVLVTELVKSKTASRREDR